MTPAEALLFLKIASSSPSPQITNQQAIDLFTLLQRILELYWEQQDKLREIELLRRNGKTFATLDALGIPFERKSGDE